jgi:hypothetical protein
LFYQGYPQQNATYQLVGVAGVTLDPIFANFPHVNKIFVFSFTRVGVFRILGVRVTPAFVIC